MRRSAITVLLGWGVAVAIVGLSGIRGGPEAADPASGKGPLGHKHNHEGITWPPQPRGITNVIIRSDIEQETRTRLLKRARAERFERKAIGHPEAKRALGNRFVRIAVIEKHDKAQGPVASHVVYFSRDRNATVEVELAHDTEEVQKVNSIPAREYQPEITEEEAAEAAGLARTHFLNQGFAQVATLNPYGILAYKPDGNGFYDTRVLYVSFHKHDDAPPEFVAWVDLTNQIILKSRQEPS